MAFPLITRSLYDELVELIKRAERDSLDSPSWPGQKVQIWLKNDVDRSKIKLEYCPRPKKQPFEEDDGSFWPTIELYRVKPHNLKKLYSKTKRWKNAIDWDDEFFAETNAYDELVKYHIHDRRSKLNISGIIKDIYEKHDINGLTDDLETFLADAEDDMLDPEDELVDSKGQSASDYGYDADDDY